MRCLFRRHASTSTKTVSQGLVKTHVVTETRCKRCGKYLGTEWHEETSMEQFGRIIYGTTNAFSRLNAALIRIEFESRAQ